MGLALFRAAAGPAPSPPALWLPWLVGLAAAFGFVPLGFLDGSAPRLQWPTGDLRQQIVALEAYLAGDWHWPPLITERLAWPEGANLLYADVLPGLALLAKLLHDLTGISVNYFGPWIFASFLLQPVGAAFLLRSVGITHPLPILCGCLMAVALPVFLLRVGHVVLHAHWLLLIALGLALRVPAAPTLRPLVQLLALTALLLAVHAYIFAMAAVLSLAALAEAVRAKSLTLRSGSVLVASWVGACALLLVLLGYLQPMGVGGGFTYYSMNLVSPLVPQASTLLPGFANWLVGEGPYKTPLDIIDATGGQQFEGFNYLGVGLHLLVLIAPVLAWRGLGRALLSRPFVVAGCVALALLSLSNEVWLAYGLLVTLPEPPAFIMDFRAPGRFFWPLAYLLLAGGIALVWRLRQPVARVLLPVLALLQVADSALRAERTYNSLRRTGVPELAAELWQPLIAEHRALRLLPSFECTGAGQHYLMDLVLHAVRAERPVSTMYLSRFPVPGRNCEAEAAGLATPIPAPGELLVVLDWPHNQAEPPPPPVPLPPDCRPFRGGLVCTLQWDALPPPLAEAFAQRGGE